MLAIKMIFSPLLIAGMLLAAQTSFARDNPLSCLQNKHALGIPADAPEWAEFDKKITSESPPLSKTGKSLVTLNHQGFDTLDPESMTQSWLVQDLLAYAKIAKQPILEIGGGYGRLTSLLLQQHAQVVYNDMDWRHVIYGRRMMDPVTRQHLKINTAIFPKGTIFPEHQFSAIVLHRVIHLLSPDEIEEGIAKINRWLISGGKIFIAVIPPQHGEYRDKVLPQYDQAWQNGNAWPGYGLKSAELLPDQAYALPDTLHVMDRRPLELVLQKYGFKIEKDGYIDMKKFGNAEKRDGHELYGIIATKIAKPTLPTSKNN